MVHEKLSQRARNELTQMVKESINAEPEFLRAWKEGVTLAGVGYFGPRTPETAKNKNDLRPNIPKIQTALGFMGGGEARFIVAMVSFFDPGIGAKLADRLNVDRSLCGLTIGIDGRGIRILARLIIHYPGW